MENTLISRMKEINNEKEEQKKQINNTDLIMNKIIKDTPLYQDIMVTINEDSYRLNYRVESDEIEYFLNKYPNALAFEIVSRNKVGDIKDHLDVISKYSHDYDLVRIGSPRICMEPSIANNYISIYLFRKNFNTYYKIYSDSIDVYKRLSTNDDSIAYVKSELYEDNKSAIDSLKGLVDNFLTSIDSIFEKSCKLKYTGFDTEYSMSFDENYYIIDILSKNNLDINTGIFSNICFRINDDVIPMKILYQQYVLGFLILNSYRVTLDIDTYVRFFIRKISK